MFRKETVNADLATPEQIAETMDGNKVKAQSELILDFSEKPNNVNVVAWGESKDNAYTFTNE